MIGLLGAGGAPAEARQSPGPIVDIQSAAGLAPDGQSITVQLLASCPERWTVVEAVVAVSQPQASGQASFPLTCIGSLRPFTVIVPSAGGTFELGEAQANASVLIKRGRTERAQDAEVVDVQPTVFVDLADTARLESGGGAVLIDVTTACPVGANGQQSFVNVSQGQTSGNGSYLPMCDGRRHTFTVRVQASQGVFQAGNAQALTFANIEHGGNGFSGVDESPIQIVT
ncbi:MAG: hypothetical protein ACRDN6_06370 [Gaiellaceae bacterium]